MSEREPTTYKPKKMAKDNSKLVTTVLNQEIVITEIVGFDHFTGKDGEPATVCRFKTNKGLLRTSGIALLKQLQEMQDEGKFPYKVTPHVEEGKRYQTF